MDTQYQIIGEAADGETGLELARRLNPDLVLLDLNMKGMTGLEVLAQIKQLSSHIQVVIMTVSNHDHDIAQAIHLGADGYLLKDMEPENILAKLNQMADGAIVMDDAIASLLAGMLKKGSGLATLENINFTQREAEIMTLLVEGLNNKLIAKALKISDGTVKVHVKHILRKTGMTSRLEAVVWAISHGFPNS